MKSRYQIILSYFFILSMAQAGELGQAGSTTTTAAVLPEALPNCVKDPAQVQRVLDTMSTNDKTKFKYNGYRKALASDDDSETAARLIYSETVAANCPAQNKQMMPLIAGVISNRIQRTKGDTKAVVYELGQFASSLNHYSQSAYKDFLCPQDGAMWAQAVELAKARTSPLGKDATMYYLNANIPGHDESGWKYSLLQTISDHGKKCLTVYANPSWQVNPEHTQFSN